MVNETDQNTQTYIDSMNESISYWVKQKQDADFMIDQLETELCDFREELK